MMKKNDVILLAGIFGVVLMVLTVWWLRGKGYGDTVEIQVGTRVIKTLPLQEDWQEMIEGTDGTNMLIIEDGKAWIESADCPDKLCVRQGKISKAGQSIICMPHQVVVRVTSK